MRTILELCEEADQWTVVQVLNQWWEQEGIKLYGVQSEAEMEVET